MVGRRIARSGRLDPIPTAIPHPVESRTVAARIAQGAAGTILGSVLTVRVQYESMTMFNVFSSTDYHSMRASTPAETAVKRLSGIGEVLSGLDLSAVHTQDDMARALWTLDTADKCIRTILAEFRTERTTDVVRKAKSLIDMIEQARDEISGYGDGGNSLS